MALLLLAWTVLPGSPLVWTAAVLAALAFRLYPLAAQGPRRPAAAAAVARLPARRAARTRSTALAQAGLQLTFLASQACEMVHAIALTLVRLAVTQRRLLEWETAAASAARGRHRDGAARLREGDDREPARSPSLGLVLVAARAPGRARRGRCRCSRCGPPRRSSPTP